MCITKEPPKKGLAGLETKKTGIFKEPPKDFEMPEKKGSVIAEEGFFRWTLDHGLLSITGSGQMPDFREDNDMYSTTAPWWRVRDKIKTVHISDGITSIGEYAFCRCYFLTSITIPNGVTTIGAEAFSDCDSLTSVTISNSVTTIEGNAFCRCQSLTSITIPNSVTTIGAGAFHNCCELSSITIRSGVTSIGRGAFACCENLTSITIPNSVTTIGADAFQECLSLRHVKMPARFLKIYRLFNPFGIPELRIPFGIPEEIVEFT